MVIVKFTPSEVPSNVDTYREYYKLVFPSLVEWNYNHIQNALTIKSDESVDAFEPFSIGEVREINNEFD